jgi:hypothetical protein
MSFLGTSPKDSAYSPTNYAGQNGLAIAVEMEGYAEVQLMLMTLPNKVQKSLFRQALRAAARPLIQSLKTLTAQISARSPVGTWTLSKNYAMKVIGDRQNNARIVLIIGAKTGIKAKTKYGMRTPSRYFHLLNNGFKHRSGKVVPGHHMIEKTLQAHAGASRQAFIDTLMRGIAREAIKWEVNKQLGLKGKSRNFHQRSIA